MGKTVGISMMKDEADVCFWTVKHMLTQVDEVLVLDNNSLDSTADLCRKAGAVVIPDPDPAYYQSKKMTELALRARLEHGADWVVPFDADEIWYSGYGTIADVLDQLDPSWGIAEATLYNHFMTSLDPSTINPFKRMNWRMKTPGALPKVACRWTHELVIHQGNHGATTSPKLKTKTGLLEVRHFPYRSLEQFVRKAVNGSKAYKAASDLPKDVGAHWRGYGSILENSGREGLEEVFWTWFYIESPNQDDRFIFDPAPLKVEYE